MRGAACGTVGAAILAGLAVGASPAHADETGDLISARNLPGLVRMLEHPDGRVRSRAAVALSGIVPEHEDSETLAPHVPRLLEATLRDPYATVREYAGRALRHALRHVQRPALLMAAVAPLIDQVQAGEVDDKRRLFAAVELSSLIPRIENEGLLTESIPRLLTATLDDPYDRVREYAGRALRSALQRSQDAEVLHAATVALAATLTHADENRRRYAAVTLSGLVQRIERLETLQTVASRVRDGSQSEDGTVKEYAGRATRHIDQRIKSAKEAAAAGKSTGT